ncbi:unnamed protein product [Symbiodinium natans]|uniref:Uncharacterized protein n=1 Tax=Symbiodinium natans TaxID=878477 RepID=A0A812UFZ9_9DINO|nr:unnamed protein product [Symbiodinium natans]
MFFTQMQGQDSAALQAAFSCYTQLPKDDMSTRQSLQCCQVTHRFKAWSLLPSRELPRAVEVPAVQHDFGLIPQQGTSKQKIRVPHEDRAAMTEDNSASHGAENLSQIFWQYCKKSFAGYVFGVSMACRILPHTARSRMTDT